MCLVLHLGSCMGRKCLVLVVWTVYVSSATSW